MILAIDPGPLESGWCVFDGARVVECGIHPNAFVLGLIQGDTAPIAPRIAIEMVASYGMPVGRDVFQTVAERVSKRPRNGPCWISPIYVALGRRPRRDPTPKPTATDDPRSTVDRGTH